MPNTLHVEDFIVLGRTVPEESKKYGKKVCMAGFSPSLKQFLRVYPLMVPIGGNANANGFKARHVYTLDLVRNPSDSRMESWRVVDERRPTSTPWDAAAECKKPALIAELEKVAVPGIHCLNACKLSLGVVLVKAGQWEPLSIPREEPDEAPEHRGLFDDLADQATALGAREFDPNTVKFAPYIRFTDAGGGGSHRIQVREWGAYILMGNPTYADQPDALWKANGYKPEKDTLLVIGNMTNHRRNWLVIKLFQYDKGAVPTLFDPDGEPVTPPPVTPPKKKPG